MNVKFTIRDLVYIAIFGALWGVLEMTLGSYLHVLFPPLAGTFLTGVIMGGLGALIALAGRHFIPRRGAVFMIAVITALMKIASLGGVKTGPVLAILIEGLLMEAALLPWPEREPPKWSFVFSGALAVVWNFFHKFLMMRLLYGQDVIAVGSAMVQEGSNLLGISSLYAAPILIILILIRLVVGGVAGWMAWSLGREVQRRLATRLAGIPSEDFSRESQ